MKSYCINFLIGINAIVKCKTHKKSLSQSMGGEWAKYGIVINNIAPGVIYSDSAQANYGPIG